MKIDHQAVIEEELASVQSLADFCKSWKSTWRGIAVAAQGILKFVYPAAATVIGYLISIADNFCATE